jgi:hypothetical protein
MKAYGFSIYFENIERHGKYMHTFSIGAISIAFDSGQG